MTRFLIFLFVLLATTAAQAQTLGYAPPISGQGIMPVTGVSAPIATANVTATTNSGAFPSGSLPNGYVRIKVLSSQATAVAVCWFGGTCTATTGETIAVSEAQAKSISRNIGAQPPTIISLTGTVLVEVEW